MAGTGPRPVGTHTLTDTALPPGTQDGNSALHNAANEGHVAVVRLLLRAGATLELPNESGKTPLFEACSGGQAAVTLLLLEAGANVNASDEVRAHGRALLPAFQLIPPPAWSPRQFGETPLFAAATEGEVEVVRVLLAQPGVLVDAVNDVRPRLRKSSGGAWAAVSQTSHAPHPACVVPPPVRAHDTHRVQP